jgi:hypothetical protein
MNLIARIEEQFAALAESLKELNASEYTKRAARYLTETTRIHHPGAIGWSDLDRLKIDEYGAIIYTEYRCGDLETYYINHSALETDEACDRVIETAKENHRKSQELAAIEKENARLAQLEAKEAKEREEYMRLKRKFEAESV